jgi:hypothetical protein
VLEPPASLLILLLVAMFLLVAWVRAAREIRARTTMREAFSKRPVQPIQESARALLESRGLWTPESQSRLAVEWIGSADALGLDGRVLRAEDDLRWLASQSGYAWLAIQALDDRVRAAFVMDADRVAFMGVRATKCSGCKYDLSGIAAPRCPECGRYLVSQPRTWGEACMMLAGVYR